MANYKVTDTELTSVANAIRTKGGTQAQLEWPTGFVSAVNDISGGGTVYTHSIYIDGGTYISKGRTVIVTASSTPFTLATLAAWLYNNGFTGANNSAKYLFVAQSTSYDDKFYCAIASDNGADITLYKKSGGADVLDTLPYDGTFSDIVVQA